MEKAKQEAIDAGNPALHSLQAAEDNLKCAQNWGMWDMFGGGFLSTTAKRFEMDSAKENMEQAKQNL